MGIPYIIPPMHVPAIAAISSPPTLHNVSKASASLKWYLDIACSIICFLWIRPSLLNPAPFPVISSTGLSSNTLATALEVVVLPIPISPMAMILTPSAAFCPTSSIPVKIACWHCSALMAGSLAKLRVPGIILCCVSPAWLTTSSIPTSTGVTFAPAWPAIILMLALPSAILWATIEVTLLSDWLIPSATTPLSAQ